MESLNIAFYTDSYTPAVDGIVSSMLNFRRELERRGHRVYVFASGAPGARQGRGTFIYPGVKFKPYPQYNVAIFPYNSVSKLSDLSIDIIHAQTPFVMGFAGLLAAKLGRYPLVSTFHTMVNNSSVVRQYYPSSGPVKAFTSKYLWKYTKFFYAHSDATIAPSLSIQRFLSKHKIRNTVVVPNSVDTKRFDGRRSGAAVRRRLGIGSRERVVLYLGRLSTEKRLDVMLKACKVMVRKGARVRFVFGGQGPAEEHYKAQARRLGLSANVSFMGFVSQSELPHLYAAADVFCMPSTFETQGIVCLEAMASGKAVVGADRLALGELIRNGRNGEKFTPDDYTGCARKIEKVLNDSEAYRKCAISTAREFSVEKATTRLLGAYESVLSKRAMY